MNKIILVDKEMEPEFVRSQFDEILVREITSLIEIDSDIAMLTYNLSTISTIIIAVEREREIRASIAAKNMPPVRFTFNTLVNELVDIGLYKDDAMLKSVKAVMDQGYLIQGYQGELKAEASAYTIVGFLDKMFPGMQGIQLIAFVIQMIDEVISERKTLEHAKDSFASTLKNSGVSVTREKAEKKAQELALDNSERRQMRDIALRLKEANIKRLAQQRFKQKLELNRAAGKPSFHFDGGSKLDKVKITSVFDSGPSEEEIEAEKRAKEEAQRKLIEETKQRAIEEAQRRIKEEAETKAREEAEKKAKEEAERIVKEEIERKAKEEAEKRIREELEKKAKEEAERQYQEALLKAAEIEERERKLREAEAAAREIERKAAELAAKEQALREAEMAALKLEQQQAELRAKEAEMAAREAEIRLKEEQLKAAAVVDDDIESRINEISGYTDDIESRIAAFESELTIPCPLCKNGSIKKEKTQTGKDYFICSDKNCRFVSWSQPYNFPCPLCKNPFLVDVQTPAGKGLKCPRASCLFSQNHLSDPALVNSVPAQPPYPQQQQPPNDYYSPQPTNYPTPPINNITPAPPQSQYPQQAPPAGYPQQSVSQPAGYPPQQQPPTAGFGGVEPPKKKRLVRRIKR
ncbi:MAG: DNA topoisomerase I [Desulfamplus sp.]|nr:DNA topoisomerase I [Desulfamplus sp.]